MNKLDVALSLFRLLNERKSIDARLVASELRVSLRTAQRYLLELSALPCVIADEKLHKYALNPDYPLKNALLRGAGPKQETVDIRKEVQRETSTHYILCLTCGNVRNCFPDMSLLLKNSGVTRDARLKLNRLASLICRRLKEGRCGFP